MNLGIVWFLRADPRRAHFMIQHHVPDKNGWCSHQGAIEQYRWPCRLYQCAHDALMQAVSTPRSKVQHYG